MQSCRYNINLRRSQWQILIIFSVPQRKPHLTLMLCEIPLIHVYGLADSLDRRGRIPSMSSPNAQRRLVAMPRSTLQHGESSSSSALNAALPVSHQTEAYNVAEPSSSPYYSPPTTFMPPESPNTPSYSAPDPSAPLTARPFQIYVGLCLSKMSTFPNICGIIDKAFWRPWI